MEIAPGTPVISKRLFEKWKPVINCFKNKPSTEIEFRFGRTSGKTFDTNVGKAHFEKAKRALEKYSKWENTKHTQSTVYYFEGGKRLSIDENTDEQTGQIKKRLHVEDFNLDSHVLDVRLGVATEEPFEYDGEETSTRQKTKERWSFVRKNLSIDMSLIKGNPDDPDADDDTEYQIELEIIDPKLIKTDSELFNILYKIFDVLTVLEG